jgi:spore maturation protein CgeB
MKIVVYGLTITSSWGNGHATTYRSLLKALARRGHRVLFIEKDVEWYRDNRDLPNPEFCSVHLYKDWNADRANLLAKSVDADVVLVGSYYPDAILASRELFETVRCPVLFYDIDTPITLNRLRAEGKTEYLCASSISAYAVYLSFTGGPALTELEQRFGARRAKAFFCSVDPELYRPSEVREVFRCDLSYLGTYASDRQPKLMGLLDGAALRLPEQDFLVAGSQYPANVGWRNNVHRLVHVPPSNHAAFYSSSRFTLNLTRDDMVRAGHSPSVRLFEASACGAAIVSDDWVGLADFLTPGEEILLPKDAYEMARVLTDVSDVERRAVGARARERILGEHSANHRAMEFEGIVSECG